jgi:hypothetical protein
MKCGRISYRTAGFARGKSFMGLSMIAEYLYFPLPTAQSVHKY